MQSFRSRLTYANVASSIALFAAVTTGGAYAANTVGSSDVIDESLQTQDFKNGEVKNADIAANGVTSSKINDGTIIGSDLATNSVSSTKINDGSILVNEIGPNAVNGSKIIGDSVTGSDIDESTLGQVPDAGTVDGLDSSEIGRDGIVDAVQSIDFSDICTVAGEWRECAAVTVNVPPDELYRIMIDSAGSFLNGGSPSRLRMCASVRSTADPFDGTGATVPGCQNIPTGITLEAGEMNNAAANGIQLAGGGASGASYVVSTAVRPDQTLVFDSGFDHAVVETLVTVAQYDPLAAAVATPQKLPRRGR